MFSYKEISVFFTQLKKQGNVFSFKTFNDEKKGSILRHDIDVSVQKAYDLAQIENELGITSSILFLTTCPLYNINTHISRKLISRLAEQNFDIGLHFDPTVYNEITDEHLFEMVTKECNIIEQITGKKVETISLHCPSIHGLYPKFKGFNNTYDEKFFNPKFYMSDSRMTFRDKNPFDFIELANENLIQVLLHPFHYSEHGNDYAQLFNDLIDDVISGIDDNFRPFNDKYVADLKNATLREHYKFKK